MAWKHPQGVLMGARPSLPLSEGVFLKKHDDAASEGYETASEGRVEEEEPNLDDSKANSPDVNKIPVAISAGLEKNQEGLGKEDAGTDHSVQIPPPLSLSETEETADYNADFLKALMDGDGAGKE
jgi:hypothetical protein